MQLIQCTNFMALTILKPLLLLLYAVFFSSALAVNYDSSTSVNSNLTMIHSLCETTPYPAVCMKSLKLSTSENISPDILNFLLYSLEIATSEAIELSGLFFNAGYSDIIENQRGTLQDCQELHQITVSSLQRSVSRVRVGDSRKQLDDARAYLSAALTNKETCLAGLDSASGPLKAVLVNSLIDAYKFVGNSLSMLASPGMQAKKAKKNRRLMSFPSWFSRNKRRILLSPAGDYDTSEVLTVAADGTGNFTKVMDAVNFAPNNSFDRTIIFVKHGVYVENVEIPSYKTNIVMVGDGRDITVIKGNRSVAEGWTTFRSATLAVSGDGFLARDIMIENNAGPEKHQAVALRVNADLTAFYRCNINGYQDTLYVHSFRQFYRECNIYGTIDYIFGNAAVVLQACNIVSRMPLPGQFTAITAQSRDNPDENTGISIQNCSILATDELISNSSSVRSYLGRPWRNYSQTVFIESYIDGFVEPTGWKEWSDAASDTLYYGEYENYGPGATTKNRVTWTGYHIMDYYDASSFSVSEFISGDAWLESTSFPYDDEI